MESKEFWIGPQETDDKISTSFRGLLSQIQTWSIAFAYDCHVEPDQISQQVLDDFSRVAPGYRSLSTILDDRKMRRSLVRGWLEKSLRESFAVTETRLFHTNRECISYRELNDWRAFTATLLSKAETNLNIQADSQAYIKQKAQNILDPIRDWATRQSSPRLEEDLRNILAEALKLSQILRCQRASWSIKPFPTPQHLSGSLVYIPFDPRTMKDVDQDEYNEDMEDVEEDENIDGIEVYPRCVSLIISLALFKRGNTDGEHFDEESCIVPWEVKFFTPEGLQAIIKAV
ncbi:MAG: hypothetical protein MMC33_003354 [Icmadophila ericetorum]|nr:hypothetical protein [Icmadophila ericetorum]